MGNGGSGVWQTRMEFPLHHLQYDLTQHHQQFYDLKQNQVYHRLIVINESWVPTVFLYQHHCYKEMTLKAMSLLEDLLYWLCDLELVTYLHITAHLQNGIIAPNILKLFEISFCFLSQQEVSPLRLAVSQALVGGLLVSSLNPQYCLQVDSIINADFQAQKVKRLNNLLKVTWPLGRELRSESSQSNLRCDFDKLGFSEVIWGVQNFHQPLPYSLLHTISCKVLCKYTFIANSNPPLPNRLSH